MNSARQFMQLLDLAAEAASGTAEADWWPDVAAGITGSLFAAVVMAVNVVNPVDGFGWFSRVYPDAARQRMPVNSPMDEVLTQDHPFSVVTRQRPVLDPIKVSDLMSERQWRGLPAYQRMRHLTGGTHHMIVQLPRQRPYMETLSIVRSDRDFDEKEMELAARLQAVAQLAVKQFRHGDSRRQYWGALADDEAAQAAAALGVTARERAVLDLLASGASTAQTAARLGIAGRTVYRHQQALHRKLGVGDAVNAVLRAQRLGLVPVDTPAPARPGAATTRLTKRELNVLHLLATGMTNAAIADALMISRRTVDVHVGTVLRKLDARTRTEAVGTALRIGLVR